MAVSEITLKALGQKYSDLCDKLVGKPLDPDLIKIAQGYARAYCDEVMDAWGIALTPVVQACETPATISIDARPEAGSYDEMMWDGLRRREGLLVEPPARRVRAKAAA